MAPWRSRGRNRLRPRREPLGLGQVSRATTGLEACGRRPFLEGRGGREPPVASLLPRWTTSRVLEHVPQLRTDPRSVRSPPPAAAGAGSHDPRWRAGRRYLPGRGVPRHTSHRPKRSGAMAGGLQARTASSPARSLGRVAHSGRSFDGDQHRAEAARSALVSRYLGGLQISRRPLVSFFDERQPPGRCTL